MGASLSLRLLAPVQDRFELQRELDELVQELRGVRQEVEEAHDGGRNVGFLSGFPSLK